MAISAYIQIKIFARVTRCRFTNFRDIGQYRIHGRMNQFTCITLVIFLSLVLFTFPFFPCSNFSSQLFTFQSFLFKYTYIPSSHNEKYFTLVSLDQLKTLKRIIISKYESLGLCE